MKLHPLWKKRLKKTLRSLDEWAAFGGMFLFVSGGLSIAIFSLAYVFGVSYYSVIAGPILAVIFAFAFYIQDIGFDVYNEYDREILKEEAEKERQREMLKNERLKERTENENKSRKKLKSVLEQMTIEKVIIEQGVKLSKLLDEIESDVSLTADEKHFLFHTLPEDIADTLNAFNEMNEENQEASRKELIALLKKKRKQIDEEIVKRHEESKKRAFKQHVRIVEERTV